MKMMRSDSALQKTRIIYTHAKTILPITLRFCTYCDEQ